METGFVRLPPYARITLGAALVAAPLLVARLSWLGPQAQELDARRAELAGKEAALTEARREQSVLAEAQARADELGLRLDRLGAARPSPAEVSALLRRLQGFAVESDLTVRAFRPRPAPQEELHAAWSYRLHVEGTYQGLARFFRRVGGLSRIVAVDDVVIRAVEPPEPGRTVAAECTATAFVLPGPPEPDLPVPEEAR